MSEVQTEQDEGTELEVPDVGEPDETPAEATPDEELEPDGDGDEADDDALGEPDDDEAGEQGDEQARQAQVNAEKAIEARYGKLAKENDRHAKRVGEIMDEDATDLIPCPVCMDGIAGWVYPPDVAEPSEEQVSRIRQFAGLPDYTNFQDVGWANECPECRGFGKVKTGSKVPGAETTGCLNCNERGWLNTRGMTPPNGSLQHPEGEILTGPQVYGTEPDERVAALQRDGYTVIAPMHFNN
jgi:rubrerythrin